MARAMAPRRKRDDSPASFDHDAKRSDDSGQDSDDLFNDDDDGAVAAA